jgi:hypothetical protein
MDFAREHARNQLRGARSFCVYGRELQRVRVDFGEEFVSRFRLHLPECKCPGPERGKSAPVAGWALRFVEHLLRVGVRPVVVDKQEAGRPIPLQNFLTWMPQHRGVGGATLKHYDYYLTDLLDCLGDTGLLYGAEVS